MCVFVCLVLFVCFFGKQRKITQMTGIYSVAHSGAGMGTSIPASLPQMLSQPSDVPPLSCHPHPHQPHLGRDCQGNLPGCRVLRSQQGIMIHSLSFLLQWFPNLDRVRLGQAEQGKTEAWHGREPFSAVAHLALRKQAPWWALQLLVHPNPAESRAVCLWVPFCQGSSLAQARLLYIESLPGCTSGGFCCFDAGFTPARPSLRRQCC